jgi:hypothetical protein
MVVSSFPASSSTAGTRPVPRYAAYFQFLTDSNKQYAILNIYWTTEILTPKWVVRKERKQTEERIQKPREFVNHCCVSCDKYICSSCPPSPTACNWNTFNSPNPNYYVLTGALVGGPDQNDNYVDSRQTYDQNQVTLDYNAGFQSAVAAFIMLGY